MKRWQFILVIAAAVFLLLEITLGPYFVFAVQSQNTKTLNAIRQEQVVQQRISTNIQSLLDFVASFQSGGSNATKSAQQSLWFQNEMRALCAATPNCQQVPLPTTP